MRALTQGPAAPARVLWQHADRGDGADYLLPARASRAAAEQEEFWTMHDYLMADPKPLTAQRLRKLVKTLELDEREFDASFDSDGLVDTLEAEALRMSRVPVLCTPAFIVNGHAVDGGSVSAAALRAAVDDELLARDAKTKTSATRPARAIAAGEPVPGAAFAPARLAQAVTVAAKRAKPR